MTEQENLQRLEDEPLNETPKLKQDERKLKDLPLLNNSDLGTIFEFTGPELNANRMGRLSPQQNDKLQANLKAEVDAMWLMVTILLGTSVLIALIVFPAGPLTIPLVASIGGFLGIFLFYSYRRQAKARVLAETLKVKQVQGTPDLQSNNLMRSGAKMVIGDKHLSISADQFMQLARYGFPFMKVYYTQNEEHVLSAEVLRRDSEDTLMDESDDVETMLLAENGLETRK